ncbi:histidine kinase [Frondihabitans sp. PhB188]|nr:histidine kinase [Frondihabitans sp. PhB188]
MMANVTTPAPTRSRTGFGPALNGVGAVVVAFWVIAGTGGPDDREPLVIGCSLVVLLIWAVRAFVRVDLLRDLAALVMVVGGAAMVGPTDGLLVTPAIIAVTAVTAETRHSRYAGPLLAALGAVITVIGGLAEVRPASFFFGVLGGYALGIVVGLNRRQTVAAAERERALLARELDLEREHQRASLLADRATVARDIHDVLAHSLGGLVIQLDAVEALLEAGRTEEAASRVAAARILAADGLGEARRAVTALRDPAADPAPSSLDADDAVAHLLAAHRGLGGSVEASGVEGASSLDAGHRRVLAGVLREALSNARRHAPGAPVRVSLSREVGGEFLRAVISNPAGQDGPLGDGSGLPGMRSRVAELDDRSTLTARRDGDKFSVVLELDCPEAGAR